MLRRLWLFIGLVGVCTRLLVIEPVPALACAAMEMLPPLVPTQIVPPFPYAAYADVTRDDATGITTGDLVFYNLDTDEYRAPTMRDSRIPTDLLWSPDGQRLALVRPATPLDSDTGQAFELLTVSRSGEVTTLTTLNNPQVRLSFSEDSQFILYSQHIGPSIQLYQVGVDGTSAAQLLAEFPTALPGGGGGGCSMAVVVHQREIGSYAPMMVAPSATGLVYNGLPASSTAGLSLWQAADGSTTLLASEVRPLAVSPEGDRVLSIYFDQVPVTNEVITQGFAITDVFTGETVEYPQYSVLSLAIWGAPGTNTIFYTRSASDGVSLFRYALDDNTETVLYAAQAFSIPRLAVTPDGEWLLFTQIEHDNREAAVNLFALRLTNPRATAVQVAADVSMFAFNAAAYSDRVE